MKKTPLILLAGAIAGATAASGQSILSEDFISPLKDDATPSAGGIFELVFDGAADGNTSFTYATWGYVGNGGIDDPATGNGLGYGAGNEIISTGVARPQSIAGTNARAVGTIFDGSAFTPGTTYTISFQVIGGLKNDGAAASATSGRMWVAEVSKPDANGGIAMDVSFNGWGAGNRPFFAQGTGSTVTWLTPDDTGTTNGTDIIGEELNGVSTLNTFDFTYTAGTDIAFAVGTYNNHFAIDNFDISVVPEPGTFALLAGVATLGLVLWRRRQAHR